jgi:hypothetical protein
MIDRSRSTAIEFSCAYPKRQTVNIGGIYPDKDNTNFEIDSEGNLDIQMALYNSSSFTNLQPSEFNILVGELLFAQIKLSKAPEQLVVQVVNCLATPE